MGSNTANRIVSGVRSKEDRSGEKTPIGYDEDTSKIGHIGVNSRSNALRIDGEIYLSQRYEWSADGIIYRGVHRSINASTSSTNWWIWKYTWTTNNITYKQGPLEGTWTGRVALGWS